MVTLSETAGSASLPQDFVPTLLLNVESGTDVVALPEGFHLPSADFARAGGDLLITVGDGTTILVRGFFDGQTPPPLALPEGGQLSGELVATLAGPQAAGQVAQSQLGLSAQPIGSVESVSGSVIAVRADGTRVELDVGDPVFQGDILETAEDGVIGIVLADETTFSMAENGRMVLDEMVYDPGAQEGSISFSVVQGVFTFVSGQVAKTDPDAMTLTTPVATIGIRGTQVGIAIPDGIKLSVVLMLEADGFIGEVIIRNAAGIEVMNLASQLIEVLGLGLPPTQLGFVTLEELVNTFGSSLRHLPLETGSGNDYGVQQGGLDQTEEEEEGLEDEEVEDLEEELVAEEVEEELVEELVDLETAGETEGEGEFTEGFTNVTDGFETNRLGVINPFTATNGGTGTGGTGDTNGDGGTNDDDDFNEDEETPVDAVEGDGGTGGASGAPDVSVSEASGEEDTEIALAISASVPDGTDTIDFVTISGIPDGASLSAGTDTGGGVWTLEPGDLAALTITPPSDFSGVFSVSVTATTATGGTESSPQPLLVSVAPVPDVPDLSVSPASGDEDTAIALGISASVPDSTETVDFITISGVPEGASLSAGTDNGGGVWTLEPGDLAGLTITPADDFNGDFDLTVTATSTDGGESGEHTLSVSVGEEPDVPDVSVSPASGDEDTAIGLSISASVPDSTETVDFVTINGVPDGASLSAGTDTGGGVWTLEPEDLAGLTITPPSDFNGDFDLTVTATSTDGGESSGQTLPVSVGEESDAPEVSVSPASGDEDTAIGLSISASVPDSTETVDFITISGVPDGASLSAGTDNGGGVWTLEPGDLAGLTITPSDDFNGDFDLTVTATSTDGSESAAQTLPVSVDPVPEDANVTFRVSQDTTGAPDYDIDSTDGFDLPPPDDYGVPQTAEFEGRTVEYTYKDADTASVSLLDGWNSIKNIEAASGDAADIILSNFVHTDVALGDGGDSSVVIDGAKRGNIATGDGNDFIDVDARSNGNGWSNVFDIDSGAGDDRVELDGDRDVTEFVVQAGAGEDEIVLEDNYDNSEVTGGLGDDLIDGGEGFDVAVFSGTCDQYEITVDEDSGDITVAGPDGTDTVRDVEVLRFDDKDLKVEDLLAPPSVSVQAASGDEDTTIALSITVTQTNPTDPVNAIVIDGLPDGATLLVGSDSGLTLDGTRITGSGPNGRLTDDDLSDLTNGKLSVTPPANSDVDFSLSVTAETEGGRTSEPANLPVTLNAVADPPVVTAVLGEPILPAAAQLAAIAPVLASVDDAVVYPLQITVELTDLDGSETLSDITVSGLPDGATLSAGTDTGNGVYKLTTAQLNNLTLRVGEDVTDDFSIDVSVSSVETEGGDTETSSVAVEVLVNDPPVLFGDGEAAVGAGQSEALSDDDLRLEDEESNADELVYELVDDVDLGALYLGDGAGGRKELDVGDTFTQEDVDLGLLVYEQDGDLVHFWDPETPDWPEASEVLQSNLTMPLEAEGVTVTFEGERASFHNTLGWFRFDDQGNPTDPQIIWVDASNGVLPKGTTASLEGLSPGEEFGLFIVQDGARKFPWLDGQVSSNNTLRFDEEGNLEFVNQGGQVVQEIGSKNLFFSDDAARNPDGLNHAIAGLKDGELKVGFEDLTGGGDKDFDDVLFTLRYEGVLGPRESVPDGFTVTARDGEGVQVADNDDPSQGYTVTDGEADFEITIDNMN